MEKRTRSFLILAIVSAVLLLLFFVNELIHCIIYAITRELIGGLSDAKTILLLAWFIVNPLISILFLNSSLPKKILKYRDLFLKVFILSIVAGFLLSAVQYTYFSISFNSYGPFAALTMEEGYINWEASNALHNHFPKTAIYFIEKTLGFTIGNQFDDGKPLYIIFPNPDPWAIGFIILASIILVSGLLHINSQVKKINLFDYILFLLAFIAITVNVIDGGIGSSTAFVPFFFLFLYISRNYFSLKNKTLQALLPLLFLSLFFLSFTLLIQADLIHETLSLPFALFIAVPFYFHELKKQKQLNFSWLNTALVILFLISSYFALMNLSNFAFGREITDLRHYASFQDSFKGGGIFFYGLPREMSLQQLNSELAPYGEIIESYKIGWIGYARIVPFKPFRTGELENRLIKKLNPSTYLFAVENVPLPQRETLVIHWFESVDSTEFLRDEFLGIKVIERKELKEENKTEITIESKIDLPWQMLSVLTEIRENGFKGKLLVSLK